ncbi:MAG: hypothetical protein JW709_00930 [Sedimentisphaerales bacterium]|nr:hypothetical protein [Sedimentisphaerales bacterium]
MKKAFFILAFLLMFGCEKNTTKESLLKIANKNDPEAFTLEDGGYPYVRSTFLKDFTELGIIKMKDG